MSPRTAGPIQLRTGPWKGVFDTTDPFDARPDDRLADLLNGIIPDPVNGSGVYQRNGFAIANNGSAITTAAGALYGQAVYTHTQLDGSTLNFLIIAGKLLRVGAPSVGAALTVTDVTPVGISINSGVGPVYITSVVKNVGGTTQSVLIVNDGVSRPWIGTNLTSTPITGTYISYDGAATAWTAIGQPVVWQGSVFFVLNAVNGVSRREDIAWSEPGQPDVGYQQATYDNNWTLNQHATGPLYALAATNQALYYFRARSIGAIIGTTITNLTSTATNDAVAVNVGCVASQTIQQFGNSIFFCDAQGRPYRFTPGTVPEPIWKQLRAVIDAQTGEIPAGQLALYSSSAIEPIRNLYLVAPWRTDVTAGDTHPAQTIYAFDAGTGVYMGRWTIRDLNDGNSGVGISTMGLLQGVEEPTLFVLGEATPGTGTLGFGWFFRIRGTANDSGQWADDQFFPNVAVTTDRQGEREDVVYNVDRVTVLSGSPAQCSVGVETSTQAFPVLGLAASVTPGSSSDGTYRMVVGIEAQGRGPAVRIWPQPASALTAPWSLHRVAITAVPAPASVDDV